MKCFFTVWRHWKAWSGEEELASEALAFFNWDLIIQTLGECFIGRAELEDVLDLFVIDAVDIRRLEVDLKRMLKDGRFTGGHREIKAGRDKDNNSW